MNNLINDYLEAFPEASHLEIKLLESEMKAILTKDEQIQIRICQILGIKNAHTVEHYPQEVYQYVDNNWNATQTELLNVIELYV